jgi:hypothetical protein
MASVDQVVQFHISRLKDKQPEVVIKTIRELVLLGEKSEPALPHLEELYKNSPYDEVKDAAQKAGLLIFQKSKEAQEAKNS